MQIERDTLVPAPPGRVFALVDDLAAYPSWMSLVHDVREEPPTGDRRTWNVELQAQVGPLARSKRLRMTRVVHEPDRRVVFERDEIDGKRHSPWILAARLHPDVSAVGSTRLTMTLTYGGNLWTGAVLQRVLDDHIERGAAALCALVTESGDVGPGR
jgi:carbon monoxide dehydrogenase subunit G